MTRTPLLALLLLPLTLSLCVPACSDEGEVEGDGLGGKADDLDSEALQLIDGTPEAVGTLRLVNDLAMDRDRLRTEVELPSSAAKGIIDHRDGGGLGSNLFDDIAELDDTKGVGPASLQALLRFAESEGYVPRGEDVLGTFDEVTFTANEAANVLTLCNQGSELYFDETVGLDSRAAKAISEATPLHSLLTVSELSFVGTSALNRLKVAQDRGAEVGIISDLDKTIVPPAAKGQELPDAPYAGMAELLNFLEHGDGEGTAGDMNFVTARLPEKAEPVPAWLSMHGVPLGPIHTGISGIPFIAEDEKVRDISLILNSHPSQRYVMFGDSSHVDPDAYSRIVASFGDRVHAAFIHDVKTIDPSRLQGLTLITHYGEAAATLFGLGLLSEDQARMVMAAVVAGGEMSADEIDTLIDAARP